jgi:hypothetical protein
LQENALKLHFILKNLADDDIKICIADNAQLIKPRLSVKNWPVSLMIFIFHLMKKAEQGY